MPGVENVTLLGDLMMITVTGPEERVGRLDAEVREELREEGGPISVVLGSGAGSAELVDEERVASRVMEGLERRRSDMKVRTRIRVSAIALVGDFVDLSQCLDSVLGLDLGLEDRGDEEESGTALAHDFDQGLIGQVRCAVLTAKPTGFSSPVTVSTSPVQMS